MTARRTRAASGWKVDDYLSYLLARASHTVASGFHREVRAAGLTVLEWRVLATLADGQARSVGELAAAALAQQSTVTKLLGRMQVAGRVERSDGQDDRRLSMVRITDVGHEALGELLKRSKTHERGTLRRLAPDEVAALKSALRKLVEEAG